jgi:hypothetical protein
MILHEITEFYTKWFSVCPNMTPKCRTTAIFKSSVKENNESNKTCRYAHDLSLYLSNFVCLNLHVKVGLYCVRFILTFRFLDRTSKIISEMTYIFIVDRPIILIVSAVSHELCLLQRVLEPLVSGSDTVRKCRKFFERGNRLTLLPSACATETPPSFAKKRSLASRLMFRPL